MTPAKFRPKLRLVFLLFTMATGLVVVGGRLVWVQGFASNRFSARAAEQRERRFVLPPQRGSIYDRNHAELAMSMDMQTVYANPRLVADKKGAAAALSPILGVESGVLEARLTKDSAFVYLLRKATPEIATQAKALGIPGVNSVAESKRLYPAGSLASHAVGFVGIDNQGLAGLELTYEELLRGKPGELLMERDPKGRPIPSGKSRFVPPTTGSDLILTIDREVQYVAETALGAAVSKFGAKGGTVIVIRPKNGEILALANSPTFDPNNLRASADEARRNRAIADVYEPGSTSKVITAAAALETGVIKPNDMLKVPDRISMSDGIFNDHAPHPPLDLTFAQVIQQSSNVGTIKVASKLGPERLFEYLNKFGYGSRTGIRFPGEATGILMKPNEWSGTSLPTIAIGQGVAVTPLQIVNVYATVANGGLAVQPKLVVGTVDDQGKMTRSPTSERRRVIKPETATRLTEILVGVTESKSGTGRNAAISGYQVAGKTGSAQKVAAGGQGYSEYVSSFIGFAPAADPELVVGVILDNPRPIWGSITAAPAFKEIMQFGLRHLGIGPGPVLQIEGTPLPAPVRSGGASPETGHEPTPEKRGDPATGAATD